MRYSRFYKCSCGAKRRLIFDIKRIGVRPTDSDFPSDLICGYRGCEQRMILIKENV